MKRLYILLLAISFSQFKAQNCAYLTNGDFDNPSMTTTSGLTVTLNGWSTTATDGLMEVWGNGYNGVNSYSGIQFVELNATQAATMYQDFNVATASAILSVKFAHRARASAGQTDSMKVEIGPVGGPYTSLGTVGDGPSAWTYRTLYTSALGAAGMYRVRFTPTYEGLGNPAIGNFLDAVSVCLEQAGVHELTNSSSAVVFPNPANENISIKFNNDVKDNFSLKVYDQQGRLVKVMNEIKGNEIKLERGNLNCGLYFFTLTSGQKNITGKFNFID